jgi:hypothetical protein
MIVRILHISSWVSLFVLVLPSLFYLFTDIQLGTVHALMVFATLIWFGSRLLLYFLTTENDG